MKRIIYIAICTTIALNSAQAQNLPDFVQQRLEFFKKEAERSLENFRIWNVYIDGSMILPRLLSSYLPGGGFSHQEILLIDSLNLNLSVGMIYDAEMRDRIVQLIRNEFREDELDALVNRQLKGRIDLEREAMRTCRFDTLDFFIVALDSFLIDQRNRNPDDSLLVRFEHIERIKHTYTIFKLFQLDTTVVFKQAFSNIVERERERARMDYLTHGSFIPVELFELCGYIGDERFVKPLIEALEKFDDTHQNQVITEALVRMRVEPYFGEYVKSRTRTIEQIKNERPRFNIEEFVYLWGTQEAFLELSKYLLSNVPWQYEASDQGVYPVSSVFGEAFELIQYYIINADLQEMLKDKDHRSVEMRIPLYDWMQKNYGNYEIRRIW
jgi:hypothetical protein